MSVACARLCQTQRLLSFPVSTDTPPVSGIKNFLINCGFLDFLNLDHLSPDFSGRIRIATCSWLAAWRSKSNLLRRPFKSSGKVDHQIDFQTRL